MDHLSKHQNINNSKKLDYDTIIIGSGAGGLSAGICLAREGQKVLILEQHDVPGGWCHSFYINGHRFTPGVHYVGLLENGQSTNELYTGLGIANDIAFYRMNTDAFEHCWIGDERFDYPANYEEFTNRLVERFPDEEKNIRKYLKIIKKIGDQLKLIPKIRGFWQQITIPFRTKEMGKYSPFTLNKVMSWFIKDPLLKSILGIQFGDHGLPPSKASFIMHAAIMDHYSSGGFYPVGGGGALIKAMTNKIKKNYGEIKTSTPVKHILLDHSKKRKRAIGVELENGKQLFAKRIISNADPGITYLNLIGKENISKKLQKRLDKTKYSCTSIMLFLTVDLDLKAAGLDSGNIWYMKDKNLDKVYNEMQQTDILSNNEFSGMFISCTTLKDPVSFDGKNHTLEVITFINYDAFNDFKNEKNKRSSKYLEFKEQIIEKFLTSLENVIPNIRQHIVQKELGTPLTNEYYINSTKGNVYGTEKSLKHIGPFAYKPKSEIENLYMCGASIVSHGVAGASYSGVQTAATILGCKQDDLIKPDASQNIKIYDAEDQKNYPEWMIKKINLKQKKNRL